MRRVACLLVDAPVGEIEGLAEACFRFTPMVSLRKGEAIFLDITGCEKLYSEKSLGLRLKLLAGRFGKSARFTVASHAGAAFALAKHGGDGAENLGALSIEALEDVASPFTPGLPGLKDPRVTRAFETLKRLGIRKIADFENLPQQTLASRFGKPALFWSALIRGQTRAAWPGFKPRARILERRAVECWGLEAMLEALREPATRALSRVLGRSERVVSVRVRVELERWSILNGQFSREWIIGFALPQGSIQGVMPILRDRLAHNLAKHTLQAPVREVIFEVIESVPGAALQKNLFSREEEGKEAFNGLASRLTEKLGETRVYVARAHQSWWPEKAYTRALKAKSSAWPKLPPRPTRLLSTPQKIAQKPQNWVFEGPERISGEWWDQGLTRDYFKVTTERGEKLWVYQQGQTLWLHGYFD